MWLFYGVILLLGLAIGSFLAMAVYRIPKSLYFNWFVECYEFLGCKPSFAKLPKLPLNLFSPRSHCPNCKATIKVIDNIPVISYILLKAKCRNCNNHISIKYLLIELITAIISVIIAMNFGFNFKLIFALFISWVLLLQAFIDWQESLIPDEITLPALWLGLIVNYFNVFVSLEEAVLGAVIGYTSFWALFWLFKIITNKDGLGYGDFKLLAMLGAWFGDKNLPLIILVASLLGSIVGGGLIYLKKKKIDTPMPFGPYLVLGGFVAMLYGKSIMVWYLS